MHRDLPASSHLLVSELVGALVVKGVCVSGQRHLTLWDPMGYTLPGFSLLEILQARILE